MKKTPIANSKMTVSRSGGDSEGFAGVGFRGDGEIHRSRAHGGPPPDRARPHGRYWGRAVELGVQLIDTAGRPTGPGVSEELIAESPLPPYERPPPSRPRAGYERPPGPAAGHARGAELIGWTPNGRPEHLRFPPAEASGCAGFNLIASSFYQLHNPRPRPVPYLEVDSGALKGPAEAREGRSGHVGVSNVPTLEQLRRRPIPSPTSAPCRTDSTSPTTRWGATHARRV